MNLWLKIRAYLARWWPDSGQGVGFSVVPDENLLWTAKFPLTLDVEGRTGVVWLSREMWIVVALKAGWVSQAEADKAWGEQIAEQITARCGPKPPTPSPLDYGPYASHDDI